MSISQDRMGGRFGMGALCLTVLFFLTVACAESLPLLSIEPAMSQVQAGTGINFAITVSGIADLYAYQFDFAYSPGLLQAQAVEEGAFLRQAGTTTIFLPGQIDDGTGTIRAIAGTRIGQEPGVSGDGVLATVALRVVGTGSSLLTLSRITLLNSQFEGIPFQSASASLMTVPEPNALGLVLVGMLSLVFRRAHKRN